MPKSLHRKKKVSVQATDTFSFCTMIEDLKVLETIFSHLIEGKRINHNLKTMKGDPKWIGKRS